MEKGDWSSKMGRFMKESFSLIKFKVMGKSIILLIVGLKEILLMEKSMEREFWSVKGKNRKFLTITEKKLFNFL